MLRVIADRFELLRQVGAGGYGVVYEARDRHTSQTVALKLLGQRNGLVEDRFELEAAVLAELDHPAIVRYVAQGTAEDGRRYLAMEWLTGHTLEQLLRQRLALADVVAVARRVVAGLAFAALRGVTHRDIKPANLFVVDDAPALTKILDFGLARRSSDLQRLTHTGVIVGTPLFMSPEQARGDATLDHRTDVFSLGTVIYSCVSGVDPFDAAQPLATLAKLCYDEPLPLLRVAPRTPPRLAALVQAMMQKERDARPGLSAIADELAAIAQALADEQGSAPQGEPTASRTMDLLQSTLSSSPGLGTSLRRRANDAAPRIRVALFIGGVTGLSAEREAELSRVTALHYAQAERMLDGSWIVLPSPTLGAGEQAVAAARCALVLRPMLGRGARFVVCTGRAMMAGVQRFGELFEQGAARLVSALPGTVQVDAASASLLGGRFELSGDERTGATLERERSYGEVPRTLLGRPTAFVGRERELAQLTLTFQECIDEGVARVVLVTGPPGSGKSRLRHELLERLRASGAAFTVIVGRGNPMRGGAQFGVVGSALSAWAELAASDPPELKRQKLAARVAELLATPAAASVAGFLGEMVGVPFPDDDAPALRAARLDPQLMADHVLESWLAWVEALSGRGTLLFCVEDLHWSDPASVRFIEAALRNAAERPMLVLVLARPEVHEAYPGLWAARDLMEIRLPKLSARVCERLLDGLGSAPREPAVREAIIERADGNPFFLEELVRAFHVSPRAEALPATILAIVQARLDALGEEPKQLIGAASVFGVSFRVPGVRALFGEGDAARDLEGALALLCERELIERVGPAREQEYTFRHGLLRDAAYLLLSDDERALGHWLAAHWLAQQGESPALLADHYERGRDLASAAHWWARAAGQALDAGSLDDVQRCGEHAIRCGAQGEARGAVCALLADARSYQQDDAGAAAWAERARACLTRGTGPWWRATQVTAVSYLRLTAPEVDLLVVQVLAAYCGDVVMPEQVMAVTILLGECWRLGRHDLAEPLEALLPAELPPPLRGRPEASLACARAIKAFIAGDLAKALGFIAQALAAQRGVGAVRDMAESLDMVSHFLHDLGAYAEAEAHLGELAAIARRIGSDRDACYGQLYLGSIHARFGRLAEAERELAAAIEGFVRLGLPSFQAEALGHMAGAQLARGALREARSSVERGLALPHVEPSARAYLLARAAEAALREGQVEEALRAASTAYALVHEHAVPEYVVIVELSYADALLADGRRELAASVVAQGVDALDRRAAQIGDSALRSSFLEQVSEHARLRALAASPTLAVRAV